MGEHVADGMFRIADLTVQRRGGTFATFVRVVESFVGPLRAFFERTNRNYTRFNYLGEWHSHHSFALLPSGSDRTTMRDLVSDPMVGARFAVLLLVRLDDFGGLEGAVTVFTQTSEETGTVELEPPQA